MPSLRGARRAMVATLLALLLAPPGPPDVCKDDLAFACEALEKECGRLLEAKGVSLGKIRKDLAKAAAAVRSTEDHRVREAPTALLERPGGRTSRRVT